MIDPGLEPLLIQTGADPFWSLSLGPEPDRKLTIYTRQGGEKENEYVKELTKISERNSPTS